VDVGPEYGGERYEPGETPVVMPRAVEEIEPDGNEEESEGLGPDRGEKAEEEGGEQKDMEKQAGRAPRGPPAAQVHEEDGPEQQEGFEEEEADLTPDRGDAIEDDARAPFVIDPPGPRLGVGEGVAVGHRPRFNDQFSHSQPGPDIGVSIRLQQIHRAQAQRAAG
jgi:hypothetical protein